MVIKVNKAKVIMVIKVKKVNFIMVIKVNKVKVIMVIVIGAGGHPRSGTTLMRAMLDAHSAVRCCFKVFLNYTPLNCKMISIVWLPAS